MSGDRLSYSLDGFARAIGVSLSTVKNLIRDGKLTRHYVEGKPVIKSEEAARYMATLPTERASAS